jgi:AcrR family transcriptional regulator
MAGSEPRERGLQGASKGRTESEALHNLQGQRLGRKGRDTRARILAAAQSALSQPETPFTLSAVAREAELRITSLYLYFADLPELLGAVLDPIMASAETSYVGHLREPWPDAALGERCLEFVEAYVGFWRAHSRALHLRNSFADAGDRRMWRYRLEGAGVLSRLLVRQMEGDPEAASGPAYSTASVLVIGLERMATTSTDARFAELTAEARPDRSGAPDPQTLVASLIRAEARIFELAVAAARAEARQP